MGPEEAALLDIILLKDSPSLCVSFSLFTSLLILLFRYVCYCVLFHCALGTTLSMSLIFFSLCIPILSFKVYEVSDFTNPTHSHPIRIKPFFSYPVLFYKSLPLNTSDSYSNGI